MNKKFRILYTLLIALLFTACSKDNSQVSKLPTGSVTIHGITGADTLSAMVPLAKDSPIVFSWQAVLGSPASGSHHITFRPDSNLLSAFTSKYGPAVLLPADNYFFNQATVSIAAGTTLSDSAQLNIVQQASKDLSPYTTYVLPVTIKSIDGSSQNIAPDQVLFLVARTGKATRISKKGWQIISASSELDQQTYAAVNVLDNDLTTTWATSLSSSPPHILSIDFGSDLLFSGINFSTPAPFNTTGGYPTKVQIAVSTDGQNWIDKGIFEGFTGSGPQTIDLGTLTARYLNYTVLEVVPYFDMYNIAVLGDLSLIP